MPKWLDKVFDYADDAFDDVVHDAAEGADRGLMDSTVSKLIKLSSDCGQLAKDTSFLCQETESKGTKMMELGQELKSTLQGFSSGMDANALETIRDLMSGDQLKEARSLADEMQGSATECLTKAVNMVQLIDDAMDTLPSGIQSAMDRALADGQGKAKSEAGIDDGSAAFDQDLKDIRECVDAVKQLNLVTAIEVGLKVFHHLTEKALRSQDLFRTFREFADDVGSMTDAWKDMNVMKLVYHVKDLWRCLKLTNVMKQAAENLGKLMGAVIELFEESTQRMTGLWSALAFCKKCMAECAEYVQEAGAICTKAIEACENLVVNSTKIRDNLSEMGQFNKKSVAALRDLADGDEIRSTITIAETLDDHVLQCVTKTLDMVNRVTEGYHNLPPIVIADIPMESGKSDEDREPDDVESNILDLDTTRGEIEKDNLIQAVVQGTKGFSHVTDNSGVCNDMLKNVDTFTKSCLATISSFLGAWDLPTASEKIRQMCRIVTLGELIKAFAERVKRLLLAIIQLMKSFFDRFRNLKLEDIFGAKVDEVVDDAVDFAKEHLGKLAFWKHD